MRHAVSAEVKSILIHGQGSAPSASPQDFSPDDPEHFGASVQIFIGEVGSDLADSFDVVVCTPSWVASALTDDWDAWRSGLTAMPDAVCPGAYFWFMPRWDLTAFEQAISAICASASPGPDWGTVASRIGRLLPWEFDYKFDAHVDRAYGEPFPPVA